MTKFRTYLLIIAMATGCLSGCSSNVQPLDTPVTIPAAPSTSSTPPVSPAPSTSVPSPAEETESVETETVQSEEFDFIVNEDSYWVAETYCSEDDDAEGPQTLDPQLWFADLMLYADGTARFRDIHETVCLVDDSYLQLTWEKSENGHFLFYSKLYSQPVLDGVFDHNILQLDYMGTTLTMKQAPEPDTPCLPAELTGTWLMVSGETEGCEWEAMPDILSSLVFRVTAYNGPLELRADLEEMDYYGTMNDAAHNQAVSILDEVLYDGCGNNSWSIQIGPKSPADENGYPTEAEFYATLTDYNTLLLQRYYTVDGYPAVSSQTYWRFPKIVSWRTPEYIELGGSNWTCTDFVNSQREDRSPPEEMEDFEITFHEDQTGFLFFGEDAVPCTWQIGNGGVILLQSTNEEFWFGGAISAYNVETTYEVSTFYEMALYYNGGILRLKMTGYG